LGPGGICEGELVAAPRAVDVLVPLVVVPGFEGAAGDEEGDEEGEGEAIGVFVLVKPAETVGVGL
jgi:hypothetical protein